MIVFSAFIDIAQNIMIIFFLFARLLACVGMYGNMLRHAPTTHAHTRQYASPSRLSSTAPFGAIDDTPLESRYRYAIRGF